MARVLLRKLPDGLYSIRVRRNRPGERAGEKPTVGSMTEIAAIVLDKLQRIAPNPVDAADAERIRRLYTTEQ